MRIGISGVKGSFSEEAAQLYATQKGIKHSPEFLVSVENVLEQVENGTTPLGIFPIENSNGGIVVEAVHAMAKHTFDIKELFEFEVNHHLLVKPGTTAARVQTIASHDQALRQCRMYLKRAWSDADLTPYPDTALAAKDLSEGTLSDTTAVIASRRASELYGLEILEEKIQDLKFNYTVFIAAEKIS